LTSRPRLGELLIQEGKIDAVQLQAALAHQRRWGKRLGECLIQLNFISELILCQTLSKALRIPIIDITKIGSEQITKDLLSTISIQTARTHRIIPIATKDIRGKKRLVVATFDPTNYKVFDEIQFRVGQPLLVMVSPDSDIEWFIRKYYLGEVETLPLNYISGISVVGDDTEGQQMPDPISSIFFDADFTGITSFSRTTVSDDKNKKK
jgi:type IV pilus assembly protein PilB